MDRELLSGLIEKSESAFTEIYNGYWKKLYGVAYNRLKDNSLAEDVVHDVFLSLWNHPNPESIANLEAYLAVATKYRVLRKIREQYREETFNQDVDDKLFVINSTEDELEARFMMRNLEKGIDRLPENLRLVFRYSRLEHKTSKEIGAILNLSHRTVENKISKALTLLREYLKYTVIFIAFFLKI